MLHWWSCLDLRSKLIFGGVLGLAANGVCYLTGFWLPKLLITSSAVLIAGLIISPDDSTNM